MDFTAITVSILKLLSIYGGYGVGIIMLTIIVRLALWPLNVQQQRSMKDMQLIQPKMKMLQERYKSDPQTMQKKMAEIYKEHNINPLGGCLPLLLQMPIFILLYSALMSPQFIQLAGDANFLFINRLDATLKGNAGVSFNGSFNAGKADFFVLQNKGVKVFLDNGQELDNVKILDPRKALKVQGDITPGEAIDFKVSLDELDLKFSQLEKVKSAEAIIVDRSTRENERIKFERNDSILTASVPTEKVKETFNIDVLILILIFAATMYLSQKVMMQVNKSQVTDPNQEAIQKTMGTMMPIMITATFVFIPIPAGVLLYLIVSNIIQVVQTVVINKQIEKDNELKKSGRKIDVEGAKPAAVKEIKTVESKEDKEDKK